MKFFKGKCGTVVTKLFEAECQGGVLEELIPNTTDASGEKHVPVISVSGQEVTVSVGEVAHPMQDAHYITFIHITQRPDESYVHTVKISDRSIAVVMTFVDQ